MTFRITRSILLASLALGLSPLAIGPVQAQATGTTRAQIKMDRDAFLAIARWDELGGQWVLREEMAMPAGVLSREEIRAMRDRFLSMNVWDELGSRYVPVKGEPRDMSKMTREQVKVETDRFLKMYRFNEPSAEYVLRTR